LFKVVYRNTLKYIEINHEICLAIIRQRHGRTLRQFFCRPLSNIRFPEICKNEWSRCYLHHQKQAYLLQMKTHLSYSTKFQWILRTDYTVRNAPQTGDDRLIGLLGPGAIRPPGNTCRVGAAEETNWEIKILKYTNITLYNLSTEKWIQG